MGSLLVAAADLLLGARCAGCGGPAVTLCRPCGEAIRSAPHESWPDPVPRELRDPWSIPPVAAGVNTDALQRIVLAWKEHGEFGLAAALAHLLAAAVVPHLEAGRAVVLIPVPTSRRSRRQRGADLVDELARSAAALLAGPDVDIVVRQALTYSRATVDQAGLDAAQRAVNLSGAFRLRSDIGLADHDIIVVDDILTTGSTITEAVRVLTASDRRPIGISVVAATPRRARQHR